MARGPVNKKQMDIEMHYGYLNIHLEQLHTMLQNPNVSADEVFKQKIKVDSARHALKQLGYFEGRKKK
jgi:hypothetical protein